MTRGEEILNAATETCSKYNMPYGVPSFIEGAKYADEHPKCPWISVKDDLPCNHSDMVLKFNSTPFITESVLVMTSYYTLFLCDMKKDDARGWIWNISTKDKITHWMPIPELPKE